MFTILCAMTLGLLGSPSYTIRAQTHAKLDACWPWSAPIAVLGCQSRDPEVARRCRQLAVTRLTQVAATLTAWEILYGDGRLLADYRLGSAAGHDDWLTRSSPDERHRVVQAVRRLSGYPEPCGHSTDLATVRGWLLYVRVWAQMRMLDVVETPPPPLAR